MHFTIHDSLSLRTGPICVYNHSFGILTIVRICFTIDNPIASHHIFQILLNIKEDLECIL
uniref:Uncharacterized protein n=1 Tax=Rhizophora mucronata TaxID=61149 RepID=A0A2P2K9N0_RHIMU